jgi:hypothetical protein
VKRLVATLLLLLICPPFLAAQNTALPKAGDRVRIVSEHDQVRAEGTIVRVSQDSIQLTDGWRRMTVHLDPADRLEKSVGRRSNAGSGALHGLVVGALVGGVVGAVQGGDSNGWFTPVQGAAAGAGLLGLTGMIVGTLFGALAGHDIWAPVTPGPAQIGLAPAPGGAISVRASITF